MQTVLVVFDDRDRRAMVEAALAGAGFDVVAAGSGRRALELLNACPIDLVAIDEMLTDMSGVQLSQLLRAAPAARDCRHLLVTGGGARGDSPFDVAAFLAGVANALPGGRSGVDPIVDLATREMFPLVVVDIETPLTDELPQQAVFAVPAQRFTRRLPELIRRADEIRSRGHVVALGNLGEDRRALAMLPLLRPEIVGLHSTLIQQPLTATRTGIAIAVCDYAEDSGAAVLATGIETEDQLWRAVALGATWGRGPLVREPPGAPRRRPRFPTRIEPRPEATPYERASAGRRPRTGTVQLLLQISQQLQARAATLGDLGIVIACVPHAGLAATTRHPIWADLARRAAVAEILGPGVSPEPLPGAFGVSIDLGDSTDPLTREWVFIVIGPDDVSCLVARDVDGGDPITRRRVEFVICHDRDLATAIAREMLRRFDPRPAP